MGAAVVPPAHEGSLRLGDCAQGSRGRLGPFNARRIVFRPDEDEIVIHDLGSVAAKAAFDKGFFRLARMDEDRIHVARLAQFDRLAGADDQQLNVQIKVSRDLGQEHVRKARVVERGGHRHLHHIRGLRGTAHRQRGNCADHPMFHSTISPLRNA